MLTNKIWKINCKRIWNYQKKRVIIPKWFDDTRNHATSVGDSILMFEQDLELFSFVVAQINDENQLRRVIDTYTYLTIEKYGKFNTKMSEDEKWNSMNDWLTMLAIVTNIQNNSNCAILEEVDLGDNKVQKLLSNFMKSFVFGYTKGFFNLSDVPFQLADISTTL